MFKECLSTNVVGPHLMFQSFVPLMVRCACPACMLTGAAACCDAAVSCQDACAVLHRHSLHHECTLARAACSVHG